MKHLIFYNNANKGNSSSVSFIKIKMLHRLFSHTVPQNYHQAELELDQLVNN